MPLNTMKDLLVEQLNELYSAEKHSTEVLPKLAKAASNPKLAQILRAHADETKEHLTRLNAVFDEIGESPKSRIESHGMKGLCEDCLKISQMPKAEPHVRDAALIAAAQHIEHCEIAGYGCAKTWASLLGYDSAARHLQQTLTEEHDSDIELTRLAETLNREAVSACG